MINITFYKRNGTYYKFVEQGHALFADSGNDIVCAAISSMTMLVVNAIEVSYKADVKYDIDADCNKITVTAMEALAEYASDETQRFAVSGIILAYYYELMDLLEEYYDFIDVNEIDEDGN